MFVNTRQRVTPSLRVFTNIYSLLIDKDGRACRNILIQFSCAYPTVISSISGKSFHFPFPCFVIFVLRYFPFHVIWYIFTYIYLFDAGSTEAGIQRYTEQFGGLSWRLNAYCDSWQCCQLLGFTEVWASSCICDKNRSSNIKENLERWNNKIC